MNNSLSKLKKIKIKKAHETYAIYIKQKWPLLSQLSSFSQFIPLGQK